MSLIPRRPASNSRFFWKTLFILVWMAGITFVFQLLVKQDLRTCTCLLQARHAFDAETEKELSLAVGDFVVVRQISPSGWSEGECRGKAGWFPSSYVERRHRIPTDTGAAEVF